MHSNGIEQRNNPGWRRRGVCHIKPAAVLVLQRYLASCSSYNIVYEVGRQLHNLHCRECMRGGQPRTPPSRPIEARTHCCKSGQNRSTSLLPHRLPPRGRAERHTRPALSAAGFAQGAHTSVSIGLQPQTPIPRGSRGPPHEQPGCSPTPSHSRCRRL